MPIGIPFLCQQHEDILERMRICPLFYLPNTRQRRPASTARTFTMKGLDRFIIKGVTPRIPCGHPSRWSPTRGSNQAELIMQRLCYSLHRSINGTRIHVQIIFGTTNCHSGLPSSSVVIVLLCAMYRAKVDVLCDSRLSNSVVVFCCFFVWKREWRRTNYYDWNGMKCQAWRWFFLRKHNLWLGFMFRTRGGGWVVYLRWWWWWWL